jgi:hypothetical protein
LFYEAPLVFLVAVVWLVVGFSGGSAIAAGVDGTVVFHNQNVLIEETFAERTFCYIDFRGQHCRVNTEGSWRVSSKRRPHFWIAVACKFTAWHTTPAGGPAAPKAQVRLCRGQGPPPDLRVAPRGLHQRLGLHCEEGPVTRQGGDVHLDRDEIGSNLPGQ